MLKKNLRYNPDKAIDAIKLLKKLAESRKVNIVYSKDLPQETDSLYVVSYTGIKLLLIKDTLKSTLREVEEIALGIGYDEALIILGKPINQLSGEVMNLDKYEAQVMAQRIKEELLIEYVK